MSSIFLPDEMAKDARKRDLAASQAEMADLPAPDVAAEARTYARKQSEPYLPSTVLTKEQKATKTPWVDLAHVTPVSEMLADPAKAVLAQDVVDELVIINDLAKDGFPTTDYGWGAEALDRSELYGKVAVGIADASDYAKIAKLEARAKWQTPSEGLGESILRGFPQQLPQFARQAGAAAGGFVAGAAPGALLGPGVAATAGALGARAATAGYSIWLGIGQTYESLNKDAGIPHDVAAPLSIIAGSLIGAIDAVSFGWLMKFPGVKQVAGALSGRMSKEAFIKAAQAAYKNPRFADLTKRVLQEGGTEVLQEWIDILSVHLGAKVAPEGRYQLPTFAEGVERSIVVGTVAAGFGAAAGGAVDLIGRAARGEQSGPVIERLYEATDPKKVKLQDRAPDVLHEVATKAAEAGQIKTLTYPLADLQTLFQQAGKTPEWVAQTMPAVARSMEEAVRSGGRVVVPFADFVTYVRPLDPGKTLLQKTALNDEASPEEAKALRRDVEAMKKEFAFPAVAEAGVEGPVAQVAADVRVKLEQAGMTPEGARDRGTLIAAGIGRLAQKLKDVNAWEVYRSAPLNITRADVLPAFLGGDKALFQRLAKVSPDEVKVEEMKQGVVRLTFPGTPLYLEVSEEEVGGHPVLTGVLGPTRIGLEHAQTFGGQGISTALYLKALEIAKQRGLGFASDFKYAQYPVTKRMYPRLTEIGIPFKETEKNWRGEDFTRNYVAPADLAGFDTKAAWVAAQLRSSTFVEALSEEEVQQGLGPLAFLAQKIEDDIRGFIRFDPAKRGFFEIVLTGKANLSTFLHESGHYLLELNRKYAAEVPEIAADMAVLEKWAGVEAGGEWSVDALEKFARGFEGYLMEGKAPSSALGRAFANFKATLLHVYRALKNLNVDLTDEVRGVMDRLLATKEEIDARRLEMGYFPSKALYEEMDPIRQGEYITQYEQAARITQDRLDREAIAELRREKTQEYQTLKTDITAEVRNEPVYQLRRFLESGEHPEPAFVGKELDLQAVEDLKLSRAVMTRLRPFLAGNGVDPAEAVGPFFRFASVSEALSSVAVAPQESTEVGRRVKAAMTEKYPAYGTRPDWLEATALERLHDADAVANAIEIEVIALFKKAGLAPPISPAKVARIAAEEATLAKPVGEMYPAQYRAAERAAWKEEMKALAAKDFKNAADQARKRLFNAEMFTATTAAMKTQKAVLAFAKSFTDREKQGRIGKVNPTIRDATKALVQAVGLMPPDGTAPLVTHMEKLEAGYATDEIDSPFMVADHLLSVRGEWKTLPYSTVLDIRDALKNLQHVVTEEGKAQLADREATPAEAVTEGEAVLAKAGLLERLGDAGEEKSKARKVRTEAEKAETTLIDMDGGKPGWWHKALFRSAESGEFDLNDRHRRRIKALREIHKKHQPEGWWRIANKKVDFLGRQMMHWELLAVIWNLGTELNRYKLLEGATARGWKGWTFENVVNRLHEVFPEVEGERNVWAWSKAMFEHISDEKTWEESSAQLERIYGVRPTKQQAISIPLPNGKTMMGGYYPLMRDPNAPPLAGEMLSATEQAVQDFSGSFSPRSFYVAHGFTEERTGKVYPVLLDPRVLTAHLYEVDHFIANAKGVIDRYRLLNNQGIRNLIVRSVGRERYNGLRAWNQGIANEGRRVSATMLQADALIGKMLWGNAIVTMGGSLLSGVNQVVSGVPAALAYLGPSGVPAFSKALLKFMAQPFKTWNEVAAASGELAATTMHIDRDIRIVVDEGFKGDWKAHARSRIASGSMIPVIFFQKAVNVVTWEAAFSIAQKENLSYEDSVARANSVVRQSQSAAGPKDLTAMQRDQSMLIRMLTTLGSYQFTLLDALFPRRFTAKEVKSSVSRMLMITMTGMVTKALFDLMFPKLEEEDKKRRKGLAKKIDQWDDTGVALRAFESMVDNVVASVPVVGRPAASWMFGREPRFGPDIPMMVERVGKGVARAVDEGRMTKQEVKAIADAVGMATGLPLRHGLFAPNEFMYEYLTGNVEENPWSMFQEALLVRPGQKGEK